MERQAIQLRFVAASDTWWTLSPWLHRQTGSSTKSCVEYRSLGRMGGVSTSTDCIPSSLAPWSPSDRAPVGTFGLGR